MDRETRETDEWWASLPAYRKRSIRRWLDRTPDRPQPLPGETPLPGMPKRPRRRDSKGRFTSG